MADEEPEVTGGETTPVEAPVQEPVGDVAPESASTETGQDDEATFLADLRERVKTGKVKPEHIAEFANPRLQSVASTLAGKFDRLREKAGRVDQILAGKGVKLPEGKTFFDISTDNDTSALVDFFESLPTAAAQRERMSEDQILKAQQEGILEAVKQFPDLRDDIQPICQTILADETMNAIANGAPQYLPLLIAGVGRDIQKQRGDQRIGALEKENAELKEALRKGGIVSRTKGETTKVKATAPEKAPVVDSRSTILDIARSVKARMDAGEIPIQ